MSGRKISLLAFFVGLAVVGAFIKIPAVVSSVALDSFPALLAAAFFGGGAGAVVAGLGHLVSAIIGGLPLGPLHFIVAVEMAVFAAVFAAIYRKGRKWTASIFFVIANALIAPLPFIFFYGVAFFIALIPSLAIGSVINMVIALLLIPRLETIFVGAYYKGEAKQ